MPSNDILDLRIDRESPYYKAAVESGFKFDEVMVEKRTEEFVGGSPYACIRGTFTCCCGNKEAYKMYVNLDLPKYDYDRLEILENKIDIAKVLERRGSFSEKHLIMDGYNKEDITRIRAPFEALKQAKVKETNVGVFCA